MQEKHTNKSPGTTSLEKGKKNKPFHLIPFALRRGPLIFLTGLFLCLVLFLVLLPRVSPIYETDAMLLVDPGKEPTLAGRERDTIPGDIGSYTRTQVRRLTGYDVLARAISSLDPDDYPVFLSPEYPEERNVFRLMSRVRVREVPMTYLISLTISAEEPQGLAPALNEIMKAFLEKVQYEQKKQYARRLDYLSLERKKIIARMDEERGELMALADIVGSMSYLQENYGSHFYKQDMLQRLYLEAKGRLSEKRSGYERARADLETIPRLDLQPFADERVADNFGINRIEQWTYEQLQHLRASIDGLTPENPDRVYVEDRMQAMNAFLDSYKERVNTETIIYMVEKQQYELDLELLKARNIYEAARSSAEHLNSLLKEAAEDASDYSWTIFQASEIKFRIDQLRERLTALNNRIDDAEMEVTAPIPMEIDKPAEPPVVPARSNLKVISMMIMALGFGSVFSFVLAFDLLDNRLRDPDEVEAALGEAGPAPIPFMTTDETFPILFAEISLEGPHHQASLALRSLAVRLELDRQKFNSSVFALAGLNPECGVTSIALNLAHILQAADHRVLVLECNMLRPGTALMESGLKTGPGLSELLTADPVAWVEAVQKEPRRGIDVMTAGLKNPGIPDRSALLRVLERARRDYDIIILDLAPVLKDEFSFFAAVHSDAALLLGREDRSLYRDLRRSMDMLLAARVPALSAVLNFSRVKRAEKVRNVMQKEMEFVSRAHRYLHKAVRQDLFRIFKRKAPSTGRSRDRTGE
jgi:polysaccharide biosynthesis transport protein